jgi:hypothetical protein
MWRLVAEVQRVSASFSRLALVHVILTLAHVSVYGE